MRGLLLVAYHFPPIQGSSGFQRALSLARYLPESGWQPHVLTVNQRAYEQVSAGSDSLIPFGTPVVRAWALDSKRHLSFRGRYLNVLEIPDRWQSWIPHAIASGVRTVRRQGLKVVMSTYPIASAHIIGCAISRLTGLPWVADLRDPMLQELLPQGLLRRRSFAWIERRVFGHAERITVTTQGCADFYIDRYGDRAREHLTVIENGYDESLFPDRVPGPDKITDGTIRLVHSGLIYSDGRNPTNFLRALRQMLDAGELRRDDLRIVFRAPGGEVPLAAMIEQFGLGEIIDIEPPVPYREALLEMMQADGLLIFQGVGCNRQIPAKVYEYVFAQAPIIGLTAEDGDTGRLLRSLGLTAIAPLEDADAIRHMLKEALPALRNRSLPRPSDAAVAALSRREKAREFAAMLDAVASS